MKRASLQCLHALLPDLATTWLGIAGPLLGAGVLGTACAPAAALALYFGLSLRNAPAQKRSEDYQRASLRKLRAYAQDAQGDHAQLVSELGALGYDLKLNHDELLERLAVVEALLVTQKNGKLKDETSIAATLEKHEGFYVSLGIFLEEHFAELSAAYEGIDCTLREFREDNAVMRKLLDDLKSAHGRAAEKLIQLYVQGETHEQASQVRHVEVMTYLAAILSGKPDPASPPESPGGPARPFSRPVLNDLDQEMLNQAKASKDFTVRLKAAVVDRDFESAEALLNDPAKNQATQQAFDFFTALGDRWYFAGEFDEAVEPYELAYALRPEDFHAGYNVMITCLQARRGDVIAHRLRAIDIGHANLERAPTRVGWANTQNALGLAYRNYPSGDPAENIRHAIRSFMAALDIRTQEAHFVDWVETIINLGTTYAQDPTGNVREAIRMFQIVLNTKAIKDYPELWAKTQAELGATYDHQSSTEQTDAPQSALKAYQAALTVYTQATHPDHWAQIQHHLGGVYTKLNADDPARQYHSALEACRAALNVRTRDDRPYDWAATQNMMGLIYAGSLSGKLDENVEHAISAFDNAFTIFTRDSQPTAWAETYTNWADAHVKRPTGDRVSNLRKAIHGYECALKVYVEERFPQDFAKVHTQIGWALIQLDGEQDQPQMLKKAYSSFCAALNVYTERRFPNRWAYTQYGLSVTHGNLSEVFGEKPVGQLGLSVARAKAALRVWTPDAFPHEHNKAAQWLRRIREEYKKAGGEKHIAFDDIPAVD